MAIITPSVFAEEDSAITTALYIYTPNDEGGYRVSLNSAFKTKLDNSSERSYTGVSPEGKSFTWNTGGPLPNPAPNGEYNGKSVTSLQAMFYYCNGLTELNLSKFDTSKVIDMSNMFRGCSSLTKLNLSSFNTNNVTTMKYIFASCGNLSELNISSFNTGNVTDMSGMFKECAELTNMDLSKFNTQKVTDMSMMFCRCTGLTTLNLNNFDTSKVTDMSDMFNSCSGLTDLSLSNFNTGNVTDMTDMFIGCSGLTTLNLSNFDTKNVINVSDMFIGCSLAVSDEAKPAAVIVNSSEVKAKLNVPAATGIDNTNLRMFIRSTLDINDNLDKVYDGDSAAEPEDFSQTGSMKTPSFSWYKNSNSKIWEKLNFAPIDVGTYKIVGSVDMDGDYYNCTGEKEFEISKADNSWIEEPSIEGWIYGSKANMPEAKAANNNDNLVVTYSKSKEGTYKLETPSNAGMYYAKFYVPEMENYKAMQKVVKFEISKMKNKWIIEPDIDNWTYENADEKPECESKFGSDTAKYVYSNSKDGKFTETIPTSPGTYYVKIVVPETENYSGIESAVKTFEIAANDNSPKTGDMSNLSLWILLSTMSAGIISAAKRRNKIEE